MTLLANGVISLTAALNPGDPPQAAVFSVTANIEGRRRSRVLISVAVRPISVETIQKEILVADSGGILFDLTALSSLLEDATEFRRVSGAFLQTDSTGLVSSDPPGGLAARDAPYEIIVGAFSPFVYEGELFFRVRLKVSHPEFSEAERSAAIPADARSVSRVAASGYSGALSVTLFSRNAQTELDLPSPPAGRILRRLRRKGLAGGRLHRRAP